MHGALALVDWLIIIGYVLLMTGIGIYLHKKVKGNMESYFLSDRGLPWWLLGTSIVATTYAADTPLAVSGLVLTKGFAGNWYWWSSALAGMLGVFFYSKLWRRSGIVTDTEFAELRYSGKSASVLRGFRAVYFSLIYNSIIIGWVNLAMAKIMGTVFGMDKLTATIICFVVTVVYTSASGLWGVVITDFIEFCTAMFTTILLSIIAVVKLGGMGNIMAKLTENFGAQRAMEMTQMVPTPDSTLMPFTAFLIYILLQWWTTGNTDGGSYFAQRMLAAKDERHARAGFLWANIAHYCLRSWPWLIIGLVAAVMFPELAKGGIDPSTGKAFDPETGYIRVMLAFSPVGLLGLMIAGFLAAYMSTINTQINWGASYMVNDLYRRFIAKNKSDKHYLNASMIATVLAALFGAIATFMMNSIVGAWQLITAFSAGVGVVYLLRWYWWRINAWSELSAMVSSITATALLYVFMPAVKFPYTLLYIVPFSLTTIVIVTILTPASKDEALVKFYKKVRPGGPGWARIRAMIPGTEGDKMDFSNFKGYLAAVGAVYCMLIGFGKLIMGPVWQGVVLIAAAAGLGVLIFQVFTDTDKNEVKPLE
ncbi:MAG: sodium:solute symporter family protein [Elusimicrobiota bacterium]